MSRLATLGWRRGVLGLVITLLLAWTAARLNADDPEIRLLLDEPWEEMRRRSSADIDPAIAGHYWGRQTRTDARLRFMDPQYGFVTPLARFFSISFGEERVTGVRMSPQIEPLLLDDTLKVVLDLQEQWRKGGWIPIHEKSDPPFADTLQWRDQLRDVMGGGTSYWQVADQYQVMLVVNRFKDDRHPTEERYLIKLALANPWVQP
ncbi:hypothetical protein [Pseudomonas sp. PSPC3-3]|uniref:hypothetical protein n=1 Tax=unclassified Pseudomonas TaxID=196821 RepID=UPI003CF4CC32